MRLLVIDDDLDVRRLTHHLLTQAGMTVLLAADGESGIEAAKEQFPDAILLDVVMPGCDGVETLRRLRSDPETAALPAIFLTARSSADEVRKLSALGAAGVITKPFDPLTFSDTVQTLLAATVSPLGQLDLEQIRNDFVESTRTRVNEMAERIDALARDGDRSHLVVLFRDFHQMAGSGATCGLPQVSRLARAGEQELEVFVREEIAPADEDLQRWLSLVERIAGELEGDPGLSDANVTSSPFDVLVADGRNEFQFQLSRALATDAQVRHVRSFDEAVAAIDEQRPQAVVVDRTLADRSGYDVIRHLRQAHRGNESIAAVVMDSRPFGDRIGAVRSGADLIFDKPVVAEEVAERLLFQLRHRHAAPGRVLVVDPEAEEARYLVEVLQTGGLQARACTDVRLFESAMAAFEPDVVVSETTLASTSGFELARLFRSQTQSRTIPWIFVSSEGATEMKVEAFRSGAEVMLEKPVEPPLLLSAVSASLERARLFDARRGRDPLTGLLTHGAFVAAVRSALGQRQRSGSGGAAIVILDIDGLREVNRAHGPEAGDRLLVRFAQLVRNGVRPGDAVARFGDDAIALLASEVDEEQATALAVRLVRTIGQTALDFRGSQLFATATAGVAPLTSPHLSASEWIDRASGALEYGKSAEKGSVAAAAGAEEFFIASTPVE